MTCGHRREPESKIYSSLHLTTLNKAGVKWAQPYWKVQCIYCESEHLEIQWSSWTRSFPLNSTSWIHHWFENSSSKCCRSAHSAWLCCLLKHVSGAVGGGSISSEQYSLRLGSSTFPSAAVFPSAQCVCWCRTRKWKLKVRERVLSHSRSALMGIKGEVCFSTELPFHLN